MVWESEQDGNGDGIFGQRFASDGSAAGTEFQINTFTPGNQVVPAVGSDFAGRFVVAWQSANDGNGYGIFGQRFASDGSAAGTEFQINTFTPDAQHNAAIGADSGGNFLVAWASYGQDGSNNGIFGQRFASDGSAAGTEFQINTFTPDSQTIPVASADAAGGFLVGWQSVAQDGNLNGVFGQRFASDGNAAGTEFQANTYTVDNQTEVGLSADGADRFIVAWASFAGRDGNFAGIFAQRYSAPTETPTSTPTETPTCTPTETPTPAGTSTATATPAMLGDPCLSFTQCQSGFCASGVCCDRACDRPGEVCNLPGREGTCTVFNVPAPAASAAGYVLAILALGAVAALQIGRSRRRTRRY